MEEKDLPGVLWLWIVNGFEYAARLQARNETAVRS